MKTQISRDTRQPSSDYSGVYLQQGRMILDADWNELTDIQKARLVDALRDAISGRTEAGGGIGGAPREGGLTISADPAGSNNVQIKPGVLYVDGMPAQVRGDAPLSIDTQPEYPLNADYDGRNLHLYADVWERSVTALEEPDLLDAALHGADTATRARTMLQVKWCPDDLDPTDPAQNPSIGDAPLTLTLRQIISSGDACDPCASQVEVDERIGNYLFRVEVHDYDPNSRELVLKWSRDNGAEAALATAMPDGFDQGDWVWEFYDQDTERLLGSHFATGIGKLRGLIRTDADLPAGADDPKTFVRQWDGYLQIDLGDGSIAEGRDRGTALVAGAESDLSHGRVVLSAGVLQINLELFELELDTGGHAFVAGDYWLATVREAEHESGDTILSAEPPRGLRHHYLRLASLDNSGRLIAEDDAFRRSMAFPPLSDLTAVDVGIANHCEGLYGAAENLQQALDNLCAIGADDVAYRVPDCVGAAGLAIRDRLLAVLDPDGDGQLTVEGALDAILCELNAHRLPYEVPGCPPGSLRDLLALVSGPTEVGRVLDELLCNLNAQRLPLDKNDPALCPDLLIDGVDTVQDALRVLCDRTGGSCPTKVSSPAQLRPLLEAFAASDAPDLWLCLGPGDYDLGQSLQVVGKRSLRISGAGSASVSLRLTSEQFEITGRGTVYAPALAVVARQILLEGLSLRFTTAGSHLLLTADDLKVDGCRFRRMGNALAEADYTMVSVMAPEAGECEMRIRDCVFDARFKVKALEALGLAEAGVTETSPLGRAVKDYVAAVEAGQSGAIAAALRDVADKVERMPFTERTAWATGITPKMEDAAVRAPTPAALEARMTEASADMPVARRKSVFDRRLQSAELAEKLLDPAAGADVLVETIGDFIAKAITYEPDHGLRLGSPSVVGHLADSELTGWLLVGTGEGATDVVEELRPSEVLQEGYIASASDDLTLSGNTLAGMRAVVAPGSHNDGVLLKPLDVHAGVVWIGNRIIAGQSFLAARQCIAQGNCFASPDLSYLVCVVEGATFTGNSHSDLKSTLAIWHPRNATLASAANLSTTFHTLP